MYLNILNARVWLPLTLKEWTSPQDNFRPLEVLPDVPYEVPAVSAVLDYARLQPTSDLLSNSCLLSVLLLQVSQQIRV